MSLDDGGKSVSSIITNDGNITASPISNASPVFKDERFAVKLPKVSGKILLT